MIYLHLGKGWVVNTEEIMGIFDLDICSQSHLTRKYLSMAEKAGQVVNASGHTKVLCSVLGRKRKNFVSLPDGCGHAAAPGRGGDTVKWRIVNV